MAPGLTISIHPDAHAAARAVAERVTAAIRGRPDMVLGLPTGRTPLPLYAELVRLYKGRHVKFARATTFNLDEFLGIPPEHPGSYRSFMQRHLFRHIDVDRANTHVLNGSAPDAEAECERYEEAIGTSGGIDMQILGIGTNGHIGFNEPGPELQARTHRVRLTSETRRSNAALFGGDPDKVPAEALSMGMSTILHARAIVLLATGKSKAACIARVVNGRITTQLPASFLQLHDDVEIVLDEAAAGKLRD